MPPASQTYDPVLEWKNPKNIPCSGIKNVNDISCSGVTSPSLNKIIIGYCTNTTKYWLSAMFQENEVASSPLILQKPIFRGIDAITVLSYG